jgi:hypothetical protein
VVVSTIAPYRKVGAFYIACYGDISPIIENHGGIKLPVANHQRQLAFARPLASNHRGRHFLRFIDGLRNPGDLLVWRRMALICCAGVWIFFGMRQFSLEADIYTSAPNAPIIQTKQVYPVHVNHGYLRYVTKEQAEKWAFSSRTTGPIIGATALTMLLLIARFRSPGSP